MTSLLIDNYDSFTWNVYQYLCKLGAQVQVYRNDEITLKECIELNPRNLVISPGPGHPSSAGVSNELIRYFAGKIPILGICLGEQAIYEVFGGIVSYAGELIHGKTSPLIHDGKGLYQGLPQGIQVTRYHSLVGDPKTLPKDLEITSETESGLIMGVRHKQWTVEGVQFHPESIVSEHGLELFANFLKWQGPVWNESSLSSTQGPTEEQGKEKEQTSILETIKQARLKDIVKAKSIPGQSRKDLERAISLGLAPPLINFEARLKIEFPNVAVLAEIKRASPSKGDINVNVDVLEQTLEYTRGGAAVISVLTEPQWFKGSLMDMSRVSSVLANSTAVTNSITARPAILRKDFILDEYQILEARLYGADSILLIVAILTDSELVNLLTFSRMLGMEPLVEVSNELEMQRALQADAHIIGVNNRDLHTFQVNMERTVSLSSLVPSSVILLALSGITCREDVIKYTSHGVKGVLVGESLMKCKDKLEFINELKSMTPMTTPLVIPMTTHMTRELYIPRSEKSKILVKMCGMTNIQDVCNAIQLGVNLIGFIFAKSKRQVSPSLVKQIISTVGQSILTRREVMQVRFVGVFSNHSFMEINHIVRETGIDLVQLHGSESPKCIPLVCVPVIKVVHVMEKDTVESLACRIESLKNVVNLKYILLDTGVSSILQPQNSSQSSSHSSSHSTPHSAVESTISQRGGSGKTFDWDLAKELSKKYPLMIAGGLNPHNISRAIQQVHPIGVDVSSGIEGNTPGVKDSNLVQEFLLNVSKTL